MRRTQLQTNQIITRKSDFVAEKIGASMDGVNAVRMCIDICVFDARTFYQNIETEYAGAGRELNPDSVWTRAMYGFTKDMHTK